MQRKPQPFNYEFGKVPSDYTCTVCKIHGVKLWRAYSTSCVELLCAACANKNQGKDYVIESDGMHTDEDGLTSDQIGWYVPAVPDEGNYTFWGYTSVPEVGCTWWKALPVKPSDLVKWIETK